MLHPRDFGSLNARRLRDGACGTSACIATISCRRVAVPLLCPECRAKKLKITQRLELPADHRSDEIAIQVIRCGKCDFRGIAIYEESRRGALDSESWSHWGYPASAAGLRALEEKIGRCPDPHNPKCGCPVHREFHRGGPGGDWTEALLGVDWDGAFGMDLG